MYIFDRSSVIISLSEKEICERLGESYDGFTSENSGAILVAG